MLSQSHRIEAFTQGLVFMLIGELDILIFVVLHELDQQYYVCVS